MQKWPTFYTQVIGLFYQSRPTGSHNPVLINLSVVFANPDNYLFELTKTHGLFKKQTKINEKSDCLIITHGKMNNGQHTQDLHKVTINYIFIYLRINL